MSRKGENLMLTAIAKGGQGKECWIAIQCIYFVFLNVLVIFPKNSPKQHIFKMLQEKPQLNSSSVAEDLRFRPWH